MAAEDRSWDPDHNIDDPPPLREIWAREPLDREVARGEALRRLRLGFAERVRALQSPVASGAFERWHFGWLLSASDSSRFDPLLPNVDAPEADAALREELIEAGAQPDPAAEAVAALRAAADEEAEAIHQQVLTQGSSTCQNADSVELSAVSGSTDIWHMRLTGACMNVLLKISDEWLKKLRAMHQRCRSGSGSSVGPRNHEGDAEDEEELERQFREDAARLLLRYKAIHGSGFQAALGGGAFAVMRSCFGISAECFASPLNARSIPFCSAFLDVDAPFGSAGSFLDFDVHEGAYEANPPFVPLLIQGMAAHMQHLLRRAEAADKPLLFAVVVGASSGLKRHSAWGILQSVAASAFGRAQWHVPLHAHGYTEGHAHICKGGAREARRMSSCDTAVFIWASSAAARRWPATAEAEAALRAAMKATVPRKLKQRSSKANKRRHAEKKRKKQTA